MKGFFCKIFLQIYLKSQKTITTTGSHCCQHIHNSHICKRKRSCLKRTPDYWTGTCQPRGPGTTAVLCVVSSFLYASVFSFLSTSYISGTSLSGKLTNKELVFPLCIALQKSHGPLIGALLGRRICTTVQKVHRSTLH